VSLLPGIVVAMIAANVLHFLVITGRVPIEGLPDVSLFHPVALFGHGLTLAVLITLAVEWFVLWGCWRQLEDGATRGAYNWARAGIEDCLSLLPRRCTLSAYEHKLEEQQARWSRPLDRRWGWYYCAALAIFVPGVVLVPLSLRPGPDPVPEPLALFLPLAVGAVETVVVFLLALRVRLRWGDLLQSWVDTAVEMQKRKTLIHKPPPRQPAPEVVPNPPVPSYGDPLYGEPAEASEGREIVFDNDMTPDQDEFRPY